MFYFVHDSTANDLTASGEWQLLHHAIIVTVFGYSSHANKDFRS